MCMDTHTLMPSSHLSPTQPCVVLHGCPLCYLMEGEHSLEDAFQVRTDVALDARQKTAARKNAENIYMSGKSVSPEWVRKGW